MKNLILIPARNDNCLNKIVRSGFRTIINAQLCWLHLKINYYLYKNVYNDVH